MRNILFLIAVAAIITSCGSGTKPKEQATTPTTEIQKSSDITEVLYFHGKKRCVTCNAIETLARNVIDSLANEKVVLKIIDISKKENEAIANKYEVTWSSLILNRGEKIENLTEMGFGYAKSQPEVFKAKLIEAIQNIEQ